MLTAAIASWHRLCGKRYLHSHESKFSTTIQYDFLGLFWMEWAFQRAVFRVVVVAVLNSNGSIRIWSAGPLN